MTDKSTQKNTALTTWITLFRRANIHLLTWIPLISFFLILFGWSAIKQSVFEGDVPEDLDELVWGFATLVGTLPGVFYIWRREMPNPWGKPIKGRLAVFSGVVGVLGFGSLAIALIFLGLFV